MVKLSRKMEYALISLKHLKGLGNDELASAKEISFKNSIPFDVVSRVLQVLNQKNIVKSIQGASGGYKLDKDLKDLNLNDLIEYIEGPVVLVKCISSDGECEIKSSCTISSPLTVLNEKVKQFYSQLSVDEILSANKNVNYNVNGDVAREVSLWKYKWAHKKQ